MPGAKRSMIGLCGPETKATAFKLMAAGMRPPQVAKLLGLAQRTVYGWRDLPEGQREIGRAAAANAAQIEQTLTETMTAARARLPGLINGLADIAGNPNNPPDVRVRATVAFLDRMGVPATSRVEATVGPAKRDLSRLTEEEFAALEALERKAAAPALVEPQEPLAALPAPKTPGDFTP